MIPAPLEPVRPALLTRVTPVARLTVGAAWLVASIVTLDPLVPFRLAVAGVIVLALWSGLPLRQVPGRLAPLGAAIVGLVGFSILLGPSNADPSIPALVVLGPLRITGPAIEGALAIGLRVVVIGLTTLLVFGPSDPTSLADSLVQQWHVPDRFAYSTLAAIRVAPATAGDWTTIGAARRVRGLVPGTMAGRIREAAGRLFVLLVASIRRGERMALAMDARGFDSGVRRTHYRLHRAGLLDLVVVAGGIAIAALALAIR